MVESFKALEMEKEEQYFQQGNDPKDTPNRPRSGLKTMILELYPSKPISWSKSHSKPVGTPEMLYKTPLNKGSLWIMRQDKWGVDYNFIRGMLKPHKSMPKRIETALRAKKGVLDSKNEKTCLKM